MPTALFRRLFAAAAVAGGLTFFGAGSTQAHDYYHGYYGRHAAVSTYVTVAKPVVHWVVRYDHCGQPYRAKAVTYRPARVRVTEHVVVGY